eukprot:5614134-Lingulodinium_polyedra.AAC.1
MHRACQHQAWPIGASARTHQHAQRGLNLLCQRPRHGHVDAVDELGSPPPRCQRLQVRHGESAEIRLLNWLGTARHGLQRDYGVLATVLFQDVDDVKLHDAH